MRPFSAFYDCMNPAEYVLCYNDHSIFLILNIIHILGFKNFIRKNVFDTLKDSRILIHIREEYVFRNIKSLIEVINNTEYKNSLNSLVGWMLGWCVLER